MKFTEEELEKIKKERMEQIDKWLDNEYGVSYTRLEELHDFAVEQDLKHREEKDKEIERLHSIIKEVRAKLYDLNYKIKEIYNVPFDISEIFEMIEILDKEKE